MNTLSNWKEIVGAIILFFTIFPSDPSEEMWFYVIQSDIASNVLYGIMKTR